MTGREHILRIGLDARSINERTCGVSRVATRLVQALSDLDREHTYVVYVDRVIPEWHLGPNFVIRKTGCARNNVIDDLRFGSILAADTLDVYHSFHALIPHILPRSCKAVVTVHDLFLVADPDFFIKYRPFQNALRLYFGYLLRRTVKRADRIVTVSGYSKREICSTFGASPEKVAVVYNAPGCAQGGVQGDLQTPEGSGGYLLYIGNCRSYKNIDVLLAGFRNYLSAAGTGRLKLVMAGNGYGRFLEVAIGKQMLQDDVVTYKHPSDDDIRKLLGKATAFILPSKYEGFGIPVLEAMACDVPVIISNAEALVEVAGGAALIFDRDKPEDLADAIGKIAGNECLRDELRRKGRRRANDFTWESSARQLRGIYMDLAGAIRQG